MHTTTLPTHPLTGLRALGMVGGRPVWPILGGSEPAPEQGATPTPTPQQSPGQPPPAEAPPAPTGEPSDDDAPRAGEDYAAFLARVGPEGAAKLALRYRTEAGDRRQQTIAAQKTAEQQAADAAAAERDRVLAELKPALVKAGLLQDDEQPDPTKLAADLTAAQAATQEQQAAARTLTLENAVLRAAPGLGANADRLLDSRRFADTVAKLDPTADDFGSKIKAAIESAVKADDSLKTTRAVRSAGLAHVGGTGGQNSGTPTTLEDAVAATLYPTR